MHTDQGTVKGALSPTCPPSGGRVAKTQPMWEVRCQVLRTVYGHNWRGYAPTSKAATDRAVEDARRHWPGFSFCIRSVTQVE